jgi:glycosyltransferase involved in cell wall biosynthesis
MPRVSVVIPSYNHARFVRAAIESILTQTYQDFEIVVTDDGSADGTADVVAAIGDPRIRLKRFPRNRGGAAALNDAIRRASGEYFCPFSSDDVFLPKKLEQQVDFLDVNQNIGALFGYPNFIDEHGRRLASMQSFMSNIFYQENRTRDEWLRYFFFNRNCLCHPTAMIRRECYQSQGLYDERLAQWPDFDMWIRLVSKYDLHITKDYLIEFRSLRDGVNASAGTPEHIIRSNWEIVQVLKRYASLPSELFQKVFAKELVEIRLGGDQKRALGQICLLGEDPALHRLGIGLLFEALSAESRADAPDGEFNHSDLIRETGRRDLFNVRLGSELDEVRLRLFATEQHLENVIPVLRDDNSGNLYASLPNLALNKRAIQSSVSEWSRGKTTEEDAGNAVNGAATEAYGFHTDYEASPWWMVDLGRSAQICRIRIFNRDDGNEAILLRASPLLVEVSTKGIRWFPLFRTLAGYRFTGYSGGDPLVWSTDEPVSARYVKISIPRREVLHLAEVEIYGRFAEDIAIAGRAP